ncbi:hypothetical protein ACFYZV_33335 [Streptomyces phaeofaciens]|uniref:hypothetical protein n=1 Tax=Streptomyces phaeofaciens TaxID=68254 RepID=UPI00369FA87D
MATEAVRTESPCAMMRRAAKSTRQEIKRRRDESLRLQGEISHLQGQPNPDRSPATLSADAPKITCGLRLVML